MKKMTYDTPSVEIITFLTEDVICTSIGGDDDDRKGIELPRVPVN